MLWLIVKNEANVIERCLTSVRPFVDAWSIVDTGSTDGTQAKILEFMADLPGELHERPWVNFGHNRSEALELARKWGDYALLMDADDVFEIDPPLDIEGLKHTLTASYYHIDVKMSGIVFARGGLTSTAKKFEYRGVVHEFLQAIDPVESPPRLEGLAYCYAPGGSRGQDPDKYKKDAIAIEHALMDEQDPFMVSRYTFYLAQTYRDSGQNEKAIATYEKRATLGGFSDEVSMALMCAGHLRELRRDDSCVIIDSYTRSWEAAPHRAEPLYYAAKFCRENDRIKAAYLYIQQARKIPTPANGLFVELSVYDWRIAYEYSIAAWYQNDFVAGLQSCYEVLGSPGLPEAEAETTRGNIGHYRRGLGLC